MKKNGYAESTIKATGKRLRSLARNCNLTDPENVKGYIANKKCTNSFKETLAETYNLLMHSMNQQWEKPFYARYDKLPKIPKSFFVILTSISELSNKARISLESGEKRIANRKTPPMK